MTECYAAMATMVIILLVAFFVAVVAKMIYEAYHGWD